MAMSKDTLKESVGKQKRWIVTLVMNTVRTVSRERLSDEQSKKATEVLEREIDVLIERLCKQKDEEHFKEVNKILNMQSKSISEGGLDYVKAFEEMEKHEKRLLNKIK